MELSPKISLDYAKKRIRIHGSTLRALSNPDYVMLLVNPDKGIIGIMACDKYEKGGNRVIISHRDSQYCEIYSKLLLDRLLSICSDLNNGKSYTIKGQSVLGGNIVQFPLHNKTITEKEV